MRIKRSVSARKKRKKVLKATKGYLNLRRSCYRKAKEAFIKAGKYAYRDRRTKKRTRRALWQIKIGNACRLEDMNYSTFINLLKKNKIELDRKILADLAENKPEIFKEVVNQVKK
ncbi:MAG: 50S ribosomal protein L20 [Candidatus Moranbacteria bacterium]|nr:50S ribosomal protein L20 [Candidatus Moranbacteria bacterium]